MQTSEIKKPVFLFLIVLVVPVFLLETTHCYSSIMQKQRILQHNGNKNITLSAKQWDRRTPKFPSIDESTHPRAVNIAERYANEKRYREAIDLLLADKSNPYYSLRECRLASYYNRMEKADSAAYWAEKCIAMNISSNQETIENEDIIIDSSFNVAPRQRNTRDENKLIKEGKGGELWLDNKYKKRQKDIDATWTKKRNETFYGYKAHVKCGAISKVILEVYTTNASTHDSQVILPLLHPNDVNKKLYLDAGYSGAKSLSTIKNELHIEPIVCEKGRRNKPLTDAQKKSNRIKSKTRCLIEHVFGFIEQSMKGFVVRTIGKIRAENNNYLTCAVYNISRWLQLISAPSQPT